MGSEKVKVDVLRKPDAPMKTETGVPAQTLSVIYSGITLRIQPVRTSRSFREEEGEKRRQKREARFFDYNTGHEFKVYDIIRVDGEDWEVTQVAPWQNHTELMVELMV